MITSIDPQQTPNATKPQAFRILCLDGGGAKGFYTLGVLSEIEAMTGRPICETFDLVYGTSTGAILAALAGLGFSVDAIHDLYRQHVPKIMSHKHPKRRSEALAKLANEVFADRPFSDFRTRVGIVATNWNFEKPMIFKSSREMLHGRKQTFTPGFGVSIANAVHASCSAYPFFEKKEIVTIGGDEIVLVDGGYCANNPTLYAIADAIEAMKIRRPTIRVVSVGVGVYPEPPPRGWKMWFAKRYLISVQLLQKTLEINTQSMDQLRRVLFSDVQTVRVSDVFEQPEMATDLLEHDIKKLNQLRQRGRESFGRQEMVLREFLTQDL
jgi:predicted acylesterase/phospholipase RssA